MRACQVSVFGGVALVGLGIRRGGVTGAAASLVGAVLVYRGLRPPAPAPPWRPRGRTRRILAAVGAGVNAGTFDQAAQRAKEDRHPAGTLIADPDEMVDEMIDDSFPASDPPSYTAS